MTKRNFPVISDKKEDKKEEPQTKGRWFGFAAWDKSITNFILDNYPRLTAKKLIAVYIALCWLKSDSMDRGLKPIELDGLVERCKKYAFLNTDVVERCLATLEHIEAIGFEEVENYKGEKKVVFYTTM